MFGNLGEMAGLMKKIGTIREQMKQMKQELAETALTGRDPAGRVVVEMTGDLTLKEFHIDPALASGGDHKLLETACADAVKDALRQFKSVSAGKLSAATGGLNMPGLM